MRRCEVAALCIMLAVQPIAITGKSKHQDIHYKLTYHTDIDAAINYIKATDQYGKQGADTHHQAHRREKMWPPFLPVKSHCSCIVHCSFQKNPASLFPAQKILLPLYRNMIPGHLW